MRKKSNNIELSDAKLTIPDINTKASTNNLQNDSAKFNFARDIEELMKSNNKKTNTDSFRTKAELADSIQSLTNLTADNNSSDSSIEGRIDDLLNSSNNKCSNNKCSNNNEIILDNASKTTNSRKKKKKKSFAYNAAMVVLVCIFVGCLAYLLNYYFKAKKSEDKYEELRELIIVDNDNEDNYYIPPEDNNISESDDNTELKPGETVTEPEFIDVDGRLVQKKYSELYKRNSDFLGWLTIGDTVINYPVMYTPNQQDYYLHRDFDKEYSDAGILFVDNNCDVYTPGDNLIIYGHNMLSGKMFASLTNYESEEYYKKYKYIKFDTIDGDGVYEVIAAFRSKIYNVDYKGFKYYKFYGSKNENEFINYVNNCRSLTPYNTSDAEYGDILITLSTCAYHTKNGRYVVVAKKVK